MKKTASSISSASPSRLIDERIDQLGDWRGEMLAKVRRLIRRADPRVVEEWKWRGVPVWSHDGIICTGESYRSVVKLTFAKGAQLSDPKRLFNASLDGTTRRAIDLREHDELDEAAFVKLVRGAVALNRGGTRGGEHGATRRDRPASRRGARATTARPGDGRGAASRATRRRDATDAASTHSE